MMRKMKSLMALGLGLMVLLGCAKFRDNPCRQAGYVEAMKNKAVAYYQSGEMIEALKAAKAAEACNPKDPELFYWIGLIHYRQGRLYDAIEYFRKSISIDNNYMESRMALGLVYLELGRHDEAIEQFELVTKYDLFERPFEAYNNLGYAYLKKGDYPRAEAALNQARRINPNYCPAYCNLGDLYSRLGRSSEAIRNLQRAIELCPQGYARPYFLLALEYGKLNNYPRACQELRRARQVENAPEREQIDDYLRLYNCPALFRGPQDR